MNSEGWISGGYKGVPCLQASYPRPSGVTERQGLLSSTPVPTLTQNARPGKEAGGCGESAAHSFLWQAVDTILWLVVELQT